MIREVMYRSEGKKEWRHVELKGKALREYNQIARKIKSLEQKQKSLLDECSWKPVY